MAHIIETPNPFQPLDGMRKHCIAGGVMSVRGWLEKEYPGFVEFPIATICLFNGAPLMRADWKDRVIQEEDVVCFTAVVGEVITWVAIISVVISIGVGIYSVLSQPTAPGETPGSDPVYSVKGQTNAIRLGEPIEVCYGRNRIYPSLAARPFYRYISNDQYQHSLYCLGQGVYDIESIQIGDTAISSFVEVETEIVLPGETTDLFATNVHTSTEAGGQTLFAYNEEDYPLPEGWVGPFPANPSGTLTRRIEVDINHPSGLYYTNKKGQIQLLDLTFQVQSRLVDDAGVPLGAWTTIVSGYALYGTMSPIRVTHGADVAEGRYEVRIRKTSPSWNTFDIKYQDKIVWESMRAFLVGDEPDYGDVTLLAVKIKATSNLNSNTAKQLNVIATRKLLHRDPSSGLWYAEPVATRSIVWAFVDVFRSLYGARITDDRFFDWDALYELEGLYEERNEHFDWIFRDPISVWEAAKAIAKVGRAVPLVNGSMLTIRRDGIATVPVALFSPDNIIKDSFSWDVRLWELEENDSLSVEYTEPSTGYKGQQVLCALPGGTSDNPKDVRFAGIQDRDHAHREGLFILASELYLRENISFETGMEGFLPTYGDLIAISHDIPRWGQSGYVLAVEDSSEASAFVYRIHVSEPLVFHTEESGGNQIMFRDKLGDVLGPFPAMVTTDPKIVEVEIDSVLGYDVDFLLGGKTEPMLFLFGIADSITKYAKIVRIEPQGGERVKITCVNYEEIIHTFDGTVTPALVIPSVPEEVPDAPVVTNLVLTRIPGADLLIQASWFAVAGALSYVVQTSADNINWTPYGVTTTPSMQLSVTPGLIYVRVAGVNVYQGPWIQSSILVSLVSGLAVSVPWEALEWTIVWWDDINIDAYEVKVYDNSGSNPVLKRTEEVVGLTYTYNYGMALTDGNVVRDMLVTVEALIQDDESSTLLTPIGGASELELHNDIPILPDITESDESAQSDADGLVGFEFVGMSSDATSATLRIFWTNPQDDDLVRFKVWSELTEGFDPEVSIPVVDETSSAIGWQYVPEETYIEVPVDSAGNLPTVYIRVAVFDVWGEEIELI